MPRKNSMLMGFVGEETKAEPTPLQNMMKKNKKQLEELAERLGLGLIKGEKKEELAQRIVGEAQ